MTMTAMPVGRRAFWRTFGGHWVTRVLGLYLTSRFVCTAVLWISWTRFDREGYTIPDDATFAEFVARAWDGAWYGEIAEHGYPKSLPVGAGGETLQSAWAFFPLYPMLARLVMQVTGLPFEVVGPGLSTLLGAAAVLLVYRLVCVAAPGLVAERPGLPYSAAAALSFFPAAGAFSLAYSDSLALVLILTTLWAVVQRRYLLAIGPLVLLGFTRAVALPMAAVVVWHLFQRCRREGIGTLRMREWLAAGALGAAAVVSGFSWIFVVGRVLGSPDAYLRAQEPWRTNGASTLPFSGWTWYIETAMGWAIFGVFGGLVVALVFSRFVRRLGPEIQAWGGAYIGYVVATTSLGASTPRYLMLAVLIPVVLAPAARSFKDDLVVIGTLSVLQVGWLVAVCLAVGITP